ncbi:unnamed protein product [Cuscuta campestris]|uniref:Chromatin assembly factor 1 subunit FAS1 n=1 Tax=Cuscuta campestris TaxID=132261 RepID=A0A484MXE0_9ASTE|nr:unnamed protein product [Cuscuta campestris]
MAVDVLEGAGAKAPDSQGEAASKGSLKRKRASFAAGVSPEEKEAMIEALREELEGLFRYYREELERRVVGDGENLKTCVSMNSAVAGLMEESSLPLTKLVDEIFAKIGGTVSGGLKIGAENISKTGVKSTVISIGQRMFYGIPGSDADVLEDDSESALWCWETRDAKLLPKSVRSAIRIRRTCRKKIYERISAVSGMLAALYKPDSHQNSKELMKASEKLSKVLAEADIRSLIHNMGQTSGAEMAEKDTKKEKILIKQMERSKREAEKEKKRLDKELQKEKLQSEKEQKRLQQEAEKEEKRREKEESELRKQLKKQQEEAEKDQRRKEKEEADLKKQQSLQKQASLMERFLKKNKSSSTPRDDPLLNSVTSNLSPDKSDKMPGSVTPLMDSILSLKDVIHAEDLWRSHLNSWQCLGHLIHSNKNAHWGLRRGPRTEVVKELKLTTNRGLTNDDELTEAKLVDGWVDTNRDSKACNVNPKNLPSGARKNFRSIKLLQFDKSHRPAFYGVWPKKSETVRGRCPFTKDPELDYEFDSDEEWEEEEPGESLSDCDKDDIESLEEDRSRGDGEEEESEDGFFVPDGYLSEDEGVEFEKNEPDSMAETKVTASLKQEVQGEEISVLRQQKYLNNLTEHALKKNQPLFILNFMHEKAMLLLDDDVTGNEKVEQACLGALKMCSFPGYPSICISYPNPMDEGDVEASPSNSCKIVSTPQVTTSALQDSDLPQIVSAIKSHGQGLNKVVESLQHKFPHISKTQIRSKVREIADFSDNRWQVKKDILVKLGISVTPEKVGSKRTMKSIATFFSKRCLPPSSPTSNNNPNETSPQPNLKTHLGSGSKLFREESENKQE